MSRRARSGDPIQPPRSPVARAALPPFRTRGDKAKAPARDAGALKCRSCEQRAGWAQEGLLSDTTPAGAGKFPPPRWRLAAHALYGCVCRKPRPFDLVKESRNVAHDGRTALLPVK